MQTPSKQEPYVVEVDFQYDGHTKISRFGGALNIQSSTRLEFDH